MWVVQPGIENSWPFSSLVTSSSPVQPSLSSTLTAEGNNSRHWTWQVINQVQSVSRRFSHLLDYLAAQSDVGATEDVSHVFWDTQVIVLIWLWHLYTRSEDIWHLMLHFQHFGYKGNPEIYKPDWAFYLELWSCFSWPEKRRHQSAFLGKKGSKKEKKCNIYLTINPREALLYHLQFCHWPVCPLCSPLRSVFPPAAAPPAAPAAWGWQMWTGDPCRNSDKVNQR